MKYCKWILTTTIILLTSGFILQGKLWAEETEELEVNIIYFGPPQVYQGEVFHFFIKVANHTDEERNVDLWLANRTTFRSVVQERLIPSRWLNGEENPHLNLTLGPNGTQTIQYTATIPAEAPWGEIEIISYLGEYPNQIFSSDSLALMVVTDEISSKESDKNSVEITVDAGQEMGEVPEVWHPGVSFGGIGAYYTNLGLASQHTLDMWDDEVGLDRGLYELVLKHWRFKDRGSSLADFGEYIAAIVEKGGQPLVRLVGTPEYLSSTDDDAYWGYPPNDLEEWEDFIYDELKYIIVKDEVVNNYHLFNDYQDHPTLGLGNNILFSCWYGIWGPDAFQFRGTDEEFFDLWSATYQAAERLEDDYPGIDIKLGGFGFGSGLDSMWGEDGFIHNLIDYSHDPNNDGDDKDRIPIDWIDYQYRRSNPFEISQPWNWNTNQRGQIQSYLEEFGYNPDDPDRLIMANAWHGQGRVNGLTNSLGNPLNNLIEAMSEIDAALTPARLYDMEAAGQRKQFRESIQDYSDDPFPLFRGMNGGIGIATLGLENEGFLGLKKAAFNSFKLIDMLSDGDIKLFSRSSKESFLNRHATVNAYATKNSQDNSIRILIWSYFSPYYYIENSPPFDQVRYTELYDLIYADIRSDHFKVELSIDNLYSLESDNIRVERYLIDKYHSNPFEYRSQICNALDERELDRCVEELPYERSYTMEEINRWTSDNNPYNVSADLEKIEDYVIQNGEEFDKEFSLMPYAVTLLILTPQEPEEGPGEITSESYTNLETKPKKTPDCPDCIDNPVSYPSDKISLTKDNSDEAPPLTNILQEETSLSTQKNKQEKNGDKIQLLLKN